MPSNDHNGAAITERVVEEADKLANAVNTNQDISDQSNSERKNDHMPHGNINATGKQHDRRDNMHVENKSGYDMVIPPNTLDNTPNTGSDSSSGRQSVDSDTLQRVLEGWCTYKNLPPQSKKVVRIFVSSTFSGMLYSKSQTTIVLEHQGCIKNATPLKIRLHCQFKRLHKTNSQLERS